MYKLTKEGIEYLEKGLPEKNLADALKKEPLNIDAAKNIIKNFKIALQWAKKKNMIRIENRKIFLIKYPPDFPEHEALKKISKQETISNEMISLLLERKLIFKSKNTIQSRAKKLIGKNITNLTPELIKTGVWKKVNFKPYNVKIIGRKKFIGKKHFYLAFLDYVKDKLVGMGFKEMKGPIIETEFWNMDALFMPQYHSARDIHDAYFVKKPKYAKSLNKKILMAVKKSHEKGTADSRGWEYQYDIKKAHRYILRSQGTVLSAKTLASKPDIPGRYFSIMRCFRYDIVDSTHLPEFFQMEGIILDYKLNMQHLVAILRMFAKEFANTNNIRIVPDYFPFTEPSAMMIAKHPKFGWMELGGAGILRQELTKPLGIKVPVIAWGLGIDRIGMCNMNIQDIRKLFTKDLKYIREKKVKY